MSLIAVRRVVAADWQALRAIRLAALTDSPYAFVETVSEASAYPEQLWRDRIAADAHLLAEVDGEFVGMAVVLPRGDGAALVGVWVRPESRGSGVIEALLDAAVAAGRDLGVGELRLWVVRDNERAHRAYARYGFVATGATQPVPGRPDDIEIAMVFGVAAPGPPRAVALSDRLMTPRP